MITGNLQFAVVGGELFILPPEKKECNHQDL